MVAGACQPSRESFAGMTHSPSSAIVAVARSSRASSTRRSRARIGDGDDGARRSDLHARVGEEDLEHPAVRLASHLAHEPADTFRLGVGAQRGLRLTPQR
jgi:hypothetical protein